MNYEKLTLEACTHAAQNERLPLRAVVQVLFFEQLQLRHAIAGTLLSANASTVDNHTEQSTYNQSEEEYDDRVDNRKGSKYRATIRENQVLRLDMDSMRTRVHELERECSTMKKVIQKIDSIGTPMNEAKTGRKKGSFGRKFGCKFKTQVCDSHESTAVDVRKARSHGNSNQR